MQCSCCDVHVPGQPHRAVPHGHIGPSSHTLALGELLPGPPPPPPTPSRAEVLPAGTALLAGAEAQWVHSAKLEPRVALGGFPSDQQNAKQGMTAGEKPECVLDSTVPRALCSVGRQHPEQLGCVPNSRSRSTAPGVTLPTIAPS